ncbi:MAG: hypothetical protein ABL903_20315 [Methylococcales bacterium]
MAKDSLLVVDEFKLGSSRVENDKLYAKSESFIQNTGNLGGQDKCNADSSLKSGIAYNRSMTISTGEHLPKTGSLFGRMLVFEMIEGDVDKDTLLRLFKAERNKQLSGLMAAFIQWLAPQIDTYKKDLSDIIINLRQEASDAGFASSHARAPEIYVNMVVGVSIFMKFLVESGALSKEQALVWDEEIERQLKHTLSEQFMYQEENDECRRFISLLKALFSSGNAHIADKDTQGPPKTRPYSWAGIKAKHWA